MNPVSQAIDRPAPEGECGLYVHVPFCQTKCGYCDFYSIPLRGRSTRTLVERVLRELAIRVPDCGYEISTVFFGGGTPTLLPLDELRSLLAAIGSLVQVPNLGEFTVEANPATVDQSKAALLVEHGVSRVSMGAQSFHPEELLTLERVHNPDDIAPSVRILREAGVRQVNLDLIFGIPGQSMQSWAESLRRAIGLGIDHIACYGLTYEPGTALTSQRDRGLIQPCDEELEAEMYLFTIETLEQAGLLQYEISNFAKPGCESRHNLMYWRNHPYIGVGPSAVGYVKRRRYKNVPDAVRYVQLMDRDGHAETESEFVDEGMELMEMLLMHLRLNEGIPHDDFRQRAGTSPQAALGETLSELVCRQLLEVDDHALRLTRQGRLVANTVMAELAAALELGALGACSQR